jgi:hypothetical protein
MLAAMLSNERKPRVLMAVSPRAAERMCRVLEGLELERPASLSDMTHALRCSSFNLVIVGCHFDGSRAIEAVNTALMHAAGARIVCVRAAPFCSSLGEATLAAFHAAAEALGVDGFLDVLQFPDDPGGNARVRALLERLVYVL